MFLFAVITCEEPEVPTGGYVVGYDLNVHSVIEYHCDVGYLLHGEARHSCGKDGEWTGEVPVCECESSLSYLSDRNRSHDIIKLVYERSSLNQGCLYR